MIVESLQQTMSVLPVHTVINCQRYRLIKHGPVFLKRPVSCTCVVYRSLQKYTECSMNTLRGDVTATIGWLDTLFYYLLLVIHIILPMIHVICHNTSA